jgi:hypothetical protein
MPNYFFKKNNNNNKLFKKFKTKIEEKIKKWGGSMVDLGWLNHSHGLWE